MREEPTAVEWEPGQGATSMRSLHHEARRVLDYWLGDAIDLGWPSQDRYTHWFGGDSSVDLEI